MNLPWNDPTLEFDSEEELQNHIAEMKRNDRVISKVFSAMDEEDVLMRNYDLHIVLPWHFRDFFLKNEKFKGKRFLFPLPEPEVVIAP